DAKALAQGRLVLAPAEAEHLDLARRGLEQALEDLDGGGLAGAVGAEQTEALAGLDGQVEGPDRFHRRPAVGVLGELRGADGQCHERIIWNRCLHSGTVCRSRTPAGKILAWDGSPEPSGSSGCLAGRLWRAVPRDRPTRQGNSSALGGRAEGGVIPVAGAAGVHRAHSVVVRRLGLQALQLGEYKPRRYLLAGPARGALRAVLLIRPVLDEELRRFAQRIDPAVHPGRRTRDPARLARLDHRLP